ncbi:hypothetical protein ATE49_03465 [Elizabethkingia miricola]|uniref:Uncharacterized protein (TIGR02646 family) n=1 Tax=Elizabethkingia miricola TaxID=172045 RepID=A0ABY3ND20_ELIMR|nr:hypothetical protein [Elizabethkingia miricola]OBS12886.1 hypothetical protein ATE49_03465 [Elizabethkingia miricola]TYO88984.1 uncharacterized protein (TIGR02646 family) [Elizabethkingia miricola]
MRFVIKREEDKTARLASDETYQALLKITNTRNKDLITDTIYREAYDHPDGKRSRVEDHLSIAYHNKCAYCERICKADIEHYRPKKGVNEDGLHPGYYWLCYEWTNLIPSCITCNREGAKHNKFPVIGPRVLAPVLLADGNINLALSKAGVDPLLNERPYLLHPEVDHPEDYFEFEIDPDGEGIRINGIDDEGRGNATIRICLLNRLEIKLDRVERVINYFKDAISGLFVKLENGDINDNQLADRINEHIDLLYQFSQQENRSHTYLCKYIVASDQNFEKIVLPFLPDRTRAIVLAAFRAYIS